MPFFSPWINAAVSLWPRLSCGAPWLQHSWAGSCSMGKVLALPAARVRPGGALLGVKTLPPVAPSAPSPASGSGFAAVGSVRHGVDAHPAVLGCPWGAAGSR